MALLRHSHCQLGAGAGAACPSPTTHQQQATKKAEPDSSSLLLAALIHPFVTHTKDFMVLLTTYASMCRLVGQTGSTTAVLLRQLSTEATAA